MMGETMEAKQSGNRMRPLRGTDSRSTVLQVAVMIIVGWSGVGSPAFADAFPANVVAGDVHLDLGLEETQPMLGRGWSVVERDGSDSYQWMNALEADVTLDVKDAGPADFWIRARPQYLPYTRQRVALYVNGRFVSEWTFPLDIRFAVHRFPVPEGFLRAGVNQLTFRAAYRKSVGADTRRLSLCVDQVLLRPLR